MNCFRTQDREASSVPPGEGSKTYRAFMYGCLVLLLDHTQEEVRGGLELMGTGDAWSRPVMPTREKRTHL